MNENGGGLLDNAFEWIAIAYIYVKTHYYFYSGVLMRIALDYDKFNGRQLIAYIIVSGLFVDATINLMTLQAYTPFMVLFSCLVLGFCGHTALRFILDDFLKDFLTAIKKRIIDAVKKK